MSRAGTVGLRSRQKHKRQDFPRPDERQRHYVTTAGLDEVWMSTQPKPEAVISEAAE